MNAADVNLRLADLCQLSASAAIDAKIALGNATDPGTNLLRERLKRQVLSLTETATELRAQALVAAIGLSAKDLARIDVVTTQADAEIRAIATTNRILTRIGQILGAGLAAVTLATQPSPANVAALAEAIEALA